jgi:uncharacterized membrane protein
VPLALRASIEINAPQHLVFELVCSPERLPEWNVSVECAWRVAPDQPVCLGSRAVFRGKLLGQTLESETEVVDFEPPRLFTTRAIRGPKLVTCFLIEPAGDGTCVAVDVKGEVPGGAFGAMLAEAFLRKELEASLARLRALGEARPSD